MSTREILQRFCLEHRCKTCPVNTPELACIAPDDPCVVSRAIDALPKSDSDYEAARADTCPSCSGPGGAACECGVAR